ncbi:hypothetical protein HY501_00545 [Candidatus Woesearchaeota archaeon]|nr:hypothetical protein [Candidatus Woesearchaeota archaeon]
MNDQQITMASLAMDLQRVAVGLQRGSIAMANRFKAEALLRQEELEKQALDDYVKKLVSASRQVLLNSRADAYEDALMYSILFQNIVQQTEKH